VHSLLQNQSAPQLLLGLARLKESQYPDLRLNERIFPLRMESTVLQLQLFRKRESTL
jgi:hypothetical protein